MKKKKEGKGNGGKRWKKKFLFWCVLKRAWVYQSNQTLLTPYTHMCVYMSSVMWMWRFMSVLYLQNIVSKGNNENINK